MRSGTKERVKTRDNKDPSKLMQSSVTVTSPLPRQQQTPTPVSVSKPNTSSSDSPGYSVMRSTRLPLGGVMLSGKKFTKVSKS